MNMRTELLANIIFLMMLLACIAGASFGVASYLSPGDVSEVSKLKRDIYNLHRMIDSVSERISAEYLESRDKHFASRLAEHDRAIMKLGGNIGCLNKIVTMTPEDVQKTLDNHEKRIKELEMWVPRPVPCEIFTIDTNSICSVGTNYSCYVKNFEDMGEAERAELFRRAMEESRIGVPFAWNYDPTEGKICR